MNDGIAPVAAIKSAGYSGPRKNETPHIVLYLGGDTQHNGVRHKTYGKHTI